MKSKAHKLAHVACVFNDILLNYIFRKDIVLPAKSCTKHLLSDYISLHKIDKSMSRYYTVANCL